jgi:hypothetical protein
MKCQGALYNLLGLRDELAASIQLHEPRITLRNSRGGYFDASNLFQDTLYGLINALLKG